MPALLKLSLEKGMLEEAKNRRTDFAGLLGMLEREKGFEPSGEFATLDPFERQMAVRGLGKSSLVDHFYTSENEILFPALIDRSVRLGMNMGKRDLRLEDTYAVSEKVEGSVVKQTSLDFEKEKAESKKVAEGSLFPKAKISFKDKAITLEKRGIAFGFTYEVLRRMQIAQANILFQRIGFKLRDQLTREALRIMVDGDGNTGSAASSSATAGAAWTYTDLMDLLFKFTNGHEASHVVVNPAMLQTILTDVTNFPQFQSMNILEEYLKTGEIRDFLGVTWRTHTAVDPKMIIAYEKSSCLTYYEETGSSIVETEKIISKQLQDTVISLNFAYGKMFDSAAYVKSAP